MAVFKSSPYGIKESLKWFYYYLCPSTKKEVMMNQLPLKRGDYKEDDVKISFLGDLMCLTDETVALPNQEMLDELNLSDLVVINLEAPITKEKIEKKISYWVFDFSEEFIINFLDTYKLNKEKVIFTIANNHIGDYEVEGLEMTIKTLGKLGLKFIGSLDDINSLPIIQIKGLKIGMTGFSEWLNCNVFSGRIGIIREKHLEQIDIKNLKKKYSLDTLIFINHWCEEFRHFPKTKYQMLATKLIRKGVDIIAGHHPHILGPMEQIDDGLCHYSLGNFFAKTLHWASRMTGIWSVHLSTQNDTLGKVASYHFLPFYMLEKKNEIMMVNPDDLPIKLKNKVKSRLELLYPSTETP